LIAVLSPHPADSLRRYGVTLDFLPELALYMSGNF
jgi:hypothetical protein